MEGPVWNDRGRTVIVTGIVLLGVASLACIARGCVRLKITKRMWSDDWLLSMAMITFFIFVGLLVRSMHWGMGKHVNPRMGDPSIIDLKVALQLWFYADLIYTMSSATLRVAAGEHLMRHVSRKWQRILIVGLTWINIVYNFYMIFALIFRCSPIHAYWDDISWFNDYHSKVCQLQIARNSKYVQMGLGAATDIIYALMPISLLRDLDLSKAQRLSMIGVSSLALLSGASALIRIPYIAAMRPLEDWTWIAVDIGIWAMVELAVGVISLCLATFTPIMTYFWPNSTRRVPNGRSRLPFYQGEYDSGPNLQGYPMGSGFGNISYVEGGYGKRKGGKRGEKSVENLAMMIEDMDMGILKTTDVSTSSEDDTSPTIPASSYFRR